MNESQIPTDKLLQIESALRELIKKEFSDENGGSVSLRQGLLALLMEQERTNLTLLDNCAQESGGWPTLLGEVPPKTRPVFWKSLRKVLGVKENAPEPPALKLYETISTKVGYRGSTEPFFSASVAASDNEIHQRQATDALEIIYVYLFRVIRGQANWKEELTPNKLALIKEMIKLALEKFPSTEGTSGKEQPDKTDTKVRAEAMILEEKINAMLTPKPSPVAAETVV